MSFERPLPASQHCRHYSYVRGENYGPRCACGVDLSRAGDESLPDSPVLKPCLPDPPASGCAWREEYTAEEHAAWAEWCEERTVRMLLAMAKIPGNSNDRKNRPEWGNSGEFECPACLTGKVMWSRARVNGHVRAYCTTPGCFSVMQ
jgi:hypothetical protein